MIEILDKFMRIKSITKVKIILLLFIASFLLYIKIKASHPGLFIVPVFLTAISFNWRYSFLIVPAALGLGIAKDLYLGLLQPQSIVNEYSLTVIVFSVVFIFGAQLKKAFDELNLAKEQLSICYDEEKGLHEQLLYVVFNSIQDGLHVIDKEYNILRSNSTLEKWYSCSMPLIGKKCYQVFHNRQEPCQPCKCFEEVQNGKTAHKVGMNKIGDRYAFMEYYYFPLVTPSGQIEGVIVNARDITEKKNTEGHLARLEALNLVGEMAASIGHEVRNPMTTVRGFLQLLNNKDEFKKYSNHFHLMINELDRANSIITDFLSVTKKRSVNKSKMNLNKIIQNMTILIKANAIVENKEVVLELNDIPDLILDEREIDQLLLNLARNGLESMDAGGTLTIKTLRIDNEVILIVEDEGTGIPTDIIAKIGTPFITTKETGTGLGLTVCFNIANRHNAVIDFETGDKGTIFYVRFKKDQIC